MGLQLGVKCCRRNCGIFILACQSQQENAEVPWHTALPWVLYLFLVKLLTKKKLLHSNILFQGSSYLLIWKKKVLPTSEFCEAICHFQKNIHSYYCQHNTRGHPVPCPRLPYCYVTTPKAYIHLCFKNNKMHISAYALESWKFWHETKQRKAGNNGFIWRGSAHKYLGSRLWKVCKEFHFLIYVVILVLKLCDLTCIWEIIYISQRKLENSRFLFTGGRNEWLKTCQFAKFLWLDLPFECLSL